MQNALLSGLSGLTANQRYLDVIGNNLANTNTVGFKSSRVSFFDVVSQTLTPGSGPSGARGGTNPRQIGRGVNVGSVDFNMIQGSLLNTGRNFDLAIQGGGFFVVSDGAENFYTRVGAFGIDADEYLVDLRTGMRVQSITSQDIAIRLNTVLQPEASDTLEFTGNLPAERNGPIAEEIATDIPFEEHQAALLTANAGPYAGIAGGETLVIRVDNGAPQTLTLPAPAASPPGMTAAELVTFLNGPGGLVGATAFDNAGTLEIRSNTAGNTAALFIDTSSTGAAAIFPPGMIGVGQSGSEATATAATDLNDLGINVTDYAPGNQILVNGSRPDGTPFSGTFIYGTGPGENGTTLGSLVTYMNSLLNAPSGGATATLQPDGTIRVVADQSGEALLTVSISDPVGAVSSGAGVSSWSENFFRTIVSGTDPDMETVVTSVYDSVGRPHPVTFQFERQDDGTWNLTASVDPLEGTVVSAPITGLGFDADGLLSIVPSNQLQVQWTGLPGTHTVTLDMGSGGVQSGLTQFGIPFSVVGTADGFEAGTLSTVGVRRDGVVEGFFTNGQVQELDRLGLALFTNSSGLEALGESLYRNTSNSGQPVIIGPEQGASGSLVSGSLEGSNVEISEQFVNLIEAQRAFQANARVISTTDEVLAELVNLV